MRNIKGMKVYTIILDRKKTAPRKEKRKNEVEERKVKERMEGGTE